jgi:predicted ATPase/DNA-binding CsgD family transcriptional regulator
MPTDRTHDLASPLPTPPTPLVGRESDIADVGAALRADHGPRLLTLTGPGGVGKTRIALAVAQAMADAFADGVCFVPLAPIRDSSLVVPTVARALGVRETGAAPLADRLAAALRAKAMLLVLDNVEQVVAAAPALAEFLARCPLLKVLVTSRLPLRVAGERVYAVLPLPTPDPGTPAAVDAFAAARVFVDRATAVDRRFALTDDNRAAIAAICCRLDGLPLAIELAAARVRHLPPQALLARLERRLPILTGGPRDAPDRQQTMRDAIAWSYDLLSPAEQTLFRRLAVFVGGCTLEAAEAVASRGVEESSSREKDGLLSSTPRLPDCSTPFDLLASLVDHSLVRQVEGDPPRFAMLETVREFALERLGASEEETDARRAQAGWYLALAQESEPRTWTGPDQAQWLDRLEAELPNMRAALAWLLQNGDAEAGVRLAGALWAYWHLRSRRAEGRSWLERALAHEAISDLTRAKGLLALGELHHLAGSRQTAEILAQSLRLSRRASAVDVTTDTLFVLGTHARDQGDNAGATRFLTEAIELAEEAGNRQLVALARLQLCVAALYQSGAEHAEPNIAEALSLLRQEDDNYGVACALLVLGWAAGMRGDAAAAAARYAESLDLWQELGTKEGVVDVLAAVAELVATIHPERATRLLAAVEALSDAIGYIMPPVEQGRFDRAAASLRATWGEAAFAGEWAVGQALAPEQAVAEAAAVLADLTASLPVSTPATRRPPTLLTPRERDVLRLVAAGRSNPEIAEALFLSRRTVTTHLTNIFAKLGVAGRAEAVALAVRHGLV